tara:strand:+ start:54 stop:251 length:198 start_codon:yes stop_codon:yes gene_type:complete
MPITPAEKFKEALTKTVRYWEIEFELQHWTIVGVLFDLAVDIMYGSHSEDDEAEEEEEDEDDDED